MLRGAMPRAEEIAGTAVLRIVVSSDSIKNATATSHGKRRLETPEGSVDIEKAVIGPSCSIGTVSALALIVFNAVFLSFDQNGYFWRIKEEELQMFPKN
jgi:hypothetical protein